MDLYTLLRTVVRRWPVAVPTLVLVLVFGAFVVSSQEPDFKASGSVVLLRANTAPVVPPAVADSGRSNPYAEFNGSVTVTAAVLATAGNSESLRARMAAERMSTDFTVEQDEGTPILKIEATADSPAKAVATVAALHTALDAELAARQDEFAVLEHERIVLEPVVLPTKASRLETARNQALTVIIALGLAAVVGVSLLAESWAQGRLRPRLARLVADPSEPTEPDKRPPARTDPRPPPAVWLAEPSPEPTAEPTPEPTAEPSLEPTVEPSLEPTAEPSVEPVPVALGEAGADLALRPASRQAPGKAPEAATEPVGEGNGSSPEPTTPPAARRSRRGRVALELRPRRE